MTGQPHPRDRQRLCRGAVRNAHPSLIPGKFAGKFGGEFLRVGACPAHSSAAAVERRLSYPSQRPPQPLLMPFCGGSTA
jgi:hypothetical protein